MVRFHLEDEIFDRAQQIEIVGRICEFLKDKENSKEKLINKFMIKAISQLENEYTDIDFIKGSITEAYQINEEAISIFVPLLYTNKTKIEVIQNTIGKLHSYKSLLGLDSYIEMNVELYALVDDDLEDGLVSWIENSGIKCIKISK